MSPMPEEARLDALLDAFPRARLLVTGDVVLDEYVWGDVDRVSPEAPVPVVRVRDETQVLGGAANVARNAVALGAGVCLCSVVGDDPAGRRIADLVKNLGVDPSGLVVAPGRPTTRKTRIIARSQQVVRFDRETDEPVSPATASLLLAAIERSVSGMEGAIVADYGKGVLSRAVAEGAMEHFREADLLVVVDPKLSIGSYRGARLLKPNLREAESLAGVNVRSDADLKRAVTRLRSQVGGGDVVITRGSRGMTIFEGDADGVDVPTVAREVFDVQGAGDTAIAALALALRAGASLVEAAIIANAASGVVVGKVGTATASLDEVRALIPHALEAASEFA